MIRHPGSSPYYTPMGKNGLADIPETAGEYVEVFAWYVQNYGAEVNLFVDHSQIVQLECLRAGIWGTTGLWGRVQTYKAP